MGLKSRLKRMVEDARTTPWPRFTVNRLRQLTHPGRKIFLIGPNRCATTTLHNFLMAQGLKSIHWRKHQGDRIVYLAQEVDRLKGDDDALRAFLNQWTVFSDFVYLTDEVFIENHTLYETYLRLFPDAYFILNDRDVDRWIASRMRHREGGFMKRNLSARGGTEETTKAAWREGFLAHREAALKFFEGHPRFLHFYIDKSDNNAFVESEEIEAVIRFLSKDYWLSPSFWTKHNTERRPKVHAEPATAAA